MTHVDDFTESHSGNRYAQWFFFLHRLPAWEQAKFATWIRQYRLFCYYKGTRYRVTGASRLGDVWLAKDMNQDSGYDLRVDVDDCQHWSKEP